MKNRLFLLLTSLFLTSPAHAIEKASEERLDEVAQKGVHVMPFGLDLTTHVFSKTDKGGIQQVIVKDKEDNKQIKLIREHLLKIAADFKKRDFSDPEKIHGSEMPGLKALRESKPADISIVYKELPNGSEITYSTEKATLVTAIHQWFDAQLSDHARHAVSGHSMHHMMHPK